MTRSLFDPLPQMQPHAKPGTYTGCAHVNRSGVHCDQPHVGRGLCKRHYMAAYAAVKNGTAKRAAKRERALTNLQKTRAEKRRAAQAQAEPETAPVTQLRDVSIAEGTTATGAPRLSVDASGPWDVGVSATETGVSISLVRHA